MNTFKRKSLHAAVLAGLGAVGMAGTANAVHVNPDGLGSVLIYPYFTTRADGGGASTAYYDNYVSIVNTTASTKAVKVRVLEGKRSAEVLDFNLFLSPFDVWTGAVVRTTDGAGMISVDRSCVVPNALFTIKDPAAITSGSLNHFKNFVYASTPADGGGTTLDRTREGYLEIFEMGDVTNATATAAAKHNTAGVPANCAYFETNDSTLTTALAAPSGGLMGGLSLINVRSGSDFSYDAVALANWHTGTPNYSRAGDVLPRLTGGNVVTSTVFTAAGNVVASTWANSRDAVSAAMMSQSVFNEWMLETNTASGTDWVVTFPTKFAYTGPVGTGAAIAPFNANFNNGLSCDIFTMNFYNREELTTTTPVIVLPSPEPSVVVTNNTFCYEANVLTFANSNMLGSTNLYNVDTTGVGRTGWAAINFTQTIQSLTPAASTVNGAAAAAQAHRGLPVVGFMIQDFSNGNVGTPPVLSNYGGNFNHKFFRSIGTTP
ncbi:MAG: hypothetical protein OEV36_05660 [Myxococcales bacterium]|nr:hypothetical protein [Myxococcales bacterium]